MLVARGGLDRSDRKKIKRTFKTSSSFCIRRCHPNSVYPANSYMLQELYSSLK